MAVKRYDGSAWQVVAGKGDQGTSSSISTWVKTASGGETSLSGNDDNSQALSYTVGQELVFINGTLLKRGADYTATDGTTITGLTALAANDVATVWTVTAFSVTNAISNTIMDAKGDLLTASGADVPAKLSVGANGTVLTADSTEALGVKWAAASAGALTLIQRSSFTSVANTGTTFDAVFTTTYKTYLVIIENCKSSADPADLYLQFRYSATTQSANYYGSYIRSTYTSPTPAGTAMSNVAQITLCDMKTLNAYGNIYFNGFKDNTINASIYATVAQRTVPGQNFVIGHQDVGRDYDGFILSASSGNITGTVAIYGLAV